MPRQKIMVAKINPVISILFFLLAATAISLWSFAENGSNWIMYAKFMLAILDAIAFMIFLITAFDGLILGLMESFPKLMDEKDFGLNKMAARYFYKPESDYVIHLTFLALGIFAVATKQVRLAVSSLGALVVLLSFNYQRAHLQFNCPEIVAAFVTMDMEKNDDPK